MGPGNRAAHLQRHRVAVPPHGAAGGTAGENAARRGHPAKDRPAAGRLLFRHQAAVDSGSRGGCAAAGRGRGAVLWHGGQLADLQADRRQSACDRCYQRRPHHAVQHPHAGMGQGHSGGTEHSRRRAARGEEQQRGVRHGESGRRGGAHCGRGGGPAGGAVRPDLLCPRQCEEYIRHRLFHADEYRRDRPRQQKRAGHHHCGAAERPHRVRAGGQCVRGRRGHPVAAG